MLGAEGTGLSRLVRERCDMIVSIPMRGRLSSLNVSAAAALATYEVARHRRPSRAAVSSPQRPPALPSGGRVVDAARCRASVLR